MTPDDHEDFEELGAPPGFDEAGRPIAVTEPEVYDEHADSASSRDDLQTAIGNLFEILANSGTPFQIGQIVVVLAFLAGRTPYETKAELARHLKVSPGRVSQILAVIPSEFKALANLKSRNAKGRRIGSYEHFKRNCKGRHRQTPGAG